MGDPTVSVSVIIPTYNRKDSLLRTLESLARQTYPAERFEVIVVDDGGTDGTESITEQDFPFTLRYLRQENQGATAARNCGALQSSGEFLVFVDDDIRLQPETLKHLFEALNSPRTIVLGHLIPPETILVNSVFARLHTQDSARIIAETESEPVSFQECMTGLLCVRRNDFLALGMFQDPTGGWPNWDDVDFGYRAHQAGYQLVRVYSAIAEHWDYALADWRKACQRWQKAGYSGAKLLERYPVLANDISMFYDKGPINWKEDNLSLILRKLARQMASSGPVMWAMESLVPVLERRAPDSVVLRLLYRWIVSGYIYRGYRAGLRDLER